jgi:hypothetical protein
VKIKLGKQFILRLYCYTYQAERSVGFALGANWAEFLEYYSGERIGGLKQLSEEIQEVLARNGLNRAPVTREEAARVVPSVNLFRYLLGPSINRRRAYWSLCDTEIRFMSSRLNELVGVLSSDQRPAPDTLISLRMDLCLCRSAIEIHCYGLPEIRRAQHLEHFWQADWITPVRLADIVGVSAMESVPSRVA